MVRYIFLGIVIASIAFSASYSQEFEYQVNEKGNAFYCDSVKIFNKEPAAIYEKFVEWFQSQLITSSDTLVFSQDNKEHIVAKKTMRINLDTNQLRAEYDFTVSIDVSFIFDKVSYCVNDIYFISSDTGEKCQNLGSEHDDCISKTKPELWSKIKFASEQKILQLIGQMEQYLTSG